MKCACSVMLMPQVRESLGESTPTQASSSWRHAALELQGEIDEPLLVPIDFAQVHLRRNLTDFIANPLRKERCL